MPCSIVTAPVMTWSGSTKAAFARQRLADTSVSQDFAKEGAGKGEFMSYSRFAVYYVPPEGALAEFGDAWLGFSLTQGCEVPQFQLDGLKDITIAPRKYGFHGTLKPPFRLVEGLTVDALKSALADLTAKLAPAVCGSLELTSLGQFLALVPTGNLGSVRSVAAACVRELDHFRTPASEAELARRRKAELSVRQDALLAQWGYPYVMEEFQFHLTLTGQLHEGETRAWAEAVRQHLPDLPGVFVLDQIALCGERADGHFELIHRYGLTG